MFSRSPSKKSSSSGVLASSSAARLLSPSLYQMKTSASFDVAITVFSAFSASG